MCEICNGNHVVHSTNSFSLEIHPCPECGPVLEEYWTQEFKKVAKKIKHARAKLKEVQNGEGQT